MFTRFIEAIAKLILKLKFGFYVLLAGIFLLVYLVLAFGMYDKPASSYQLYDVTSRFEYQYHWFNAGAGEKRAVYVIDIDEASLSELASEYGRWPWSRGVLAEFIEYLSLAEPAAVGVDIIIWRWGAMVCRVWPLS